MSEILHRNNVPLVVDLDGTLIKTDLLYEAIILLIKKNFLYIFSCLIWLCKGKVYFKNKVFSIVFINTELLPYNDDLLNFLKKENSNGRELVLATASLQSSASEISRRYPIFAKVFGTESVNLKGKKKLELLIDNYGQKKFDYIGNSYADLSILASSRYSYLVNPKRFLESKARKTSDLKYIWHSKKNFLFTCLKAARAYQWIKNLLVFVPLITSHSFHSFDPIFKTFLAFISLNFVASAGYLFNDLSDLEADRIHINKRNRPIASGELSIPNAILSGIILFVAGLTISAFLGIFFVCILLVYFSTSFLYSIYLKKIAIYDVFVLALLYSIRVYAGAIVINVTLSFWLIAFSTFIFLSLALVKRYSELIQLKKELNLHTKARGYTIEDINMLQTMGIVSGFLAVIVFSLYIDSPEVSLLYSKPKFLWLISLLFLFWIIRIWHKTIHGKMTDDPIIFAIKDVTSYCIFFLVSLVIVISI